jgi:nicotinamidase-related amidase
MGRLLERAASVLIVIDAQPGFAPDQRVRAPAADAEPQATDVIARIAWLVGVAAALGVPVVVTEEDPDRNGPTDPAIAARLPPDTPILAKPVFGLADVPAILEAVEATGRRTAVLAGMETDVCISHSALGLLDRGYAVAVVADATFSPGAAHEHGLRRMAETGASVIHAKGVYYEWLRTVDAATAFRLAHPELGQPPGFRL